MSKTSTVHTRIDTNLKTNVDLIFAQLGLTSAMAINLFYQQVELQGGLPFEIKLPDKILAEKKLFEEIEKSKESAKAQGFISFADSKKAILG